VFWWQKSAVNAASANHMTSSVSILDEELRSKIEENARLHKQVKMAPKNVLIQIVVTTISRL